MRGREKVLWFILMCGLFWTLFCSTWFIYTVYNAALHTGIATLNMVAFCELWWEIPLFTALYILAVMAVFITIKKEW